MDLSFSERWNRHFSRIRRRRLRFVLFLATLLIAGLLARPVAAEIPRGVFSLFGTGTPATNDALENPDVAGISVRQNWVDLEPSEGNFDWSFLDSEVAKAAAAGKVVLLRIITQGGKPTWVT